jgi:hypothetical protein
MAEGEDPPRLSKRRGYIFHCFRLKTFLSQGVVVENGLNKSGGSLTIEGWGTKKRSPLK